MGTRPTSDDEMRRSYIPRRDEGGAKLCSMHGCPNRLQGRQRRWCSKKCGSDAFASWDWKAARGLVYERDRGVCSNCGINTEDLRKAFRWFNDWLHKEDARAGNSLRGVTFRTEPTLRSLMSAKGIPKHLALEDNFWQADHIIPLAEGGKLCDLDNLRTVCIPCHKKHTAALAARLAQQRRVAKATTLSQSQPALFSASISSLASLT